MYALHARDKSRKKGKKKTGAFKYIHWGEKKNFAEPNQGRRGVQLPRKAVIRVLYSTGRS